MRHLTASGIPQVRGSLAGAPSQRSARPRMARRSESLVTRRSHLTVLLLLAAAVSWGCSQAPKMPTLKKSGRQQQQQAPKICPHIALELFLNAHKQINPSETGQPMPVEVQAHLLKDRQQFDLLDYDSLRRDAQKMLGIDLVQTLSFVVFPGDIKIHPFKAPAGVNYVAVVGLFRKVEGELWRLVFDVRHLADKCDANQLNAPLKANLYKNTLRLDKDMPQDPASTSK